MKDDHSSQVSNSNRNLSYFYKNSPCSGIHLAGILNGITHSRKIQRSSTVAAVTVIKPYRPEIAYRQR